MMSCIILIYIFDILYPSNVLFYAESSLFSERIVNSAGKPKEVLIVNRNYVKVRELRLM